MIPINTPLKMPKAALWYSVAAGAFIIAIIFSVIFPFAFAFQSSPACQNVVCRFTSAATVGILFLGFGGLLELYFFLYYSTFSFLLTSTNIVINSGVFIKGSKVIDFNKIQNINMTTGPIQALFGVASVQIWTASPDQIVITKGSATARPSGYIVLYKEDAEWLKNFLVQGMDSSGNAPAQTGL